MTHYPNQQSSSDEWRREIESLDERDPLGFYCLGTYDPNYVSCLQPEIEDDRNKNA